PPAVPLGDDHIDSADPHRSLAHGRDASPPRQIDRLTAAKRTTHRGETYDSPAGRSDGPNASGRRTSSRVGPCPASTRHSGPPNSYSTCLHRPHGRSSQPSPERHATATSRPPPVS